MNGTHTPEPDGVIRRLKACLNGKRSQAENPAVPVTPAELARDAALPALDSSAVRGLPRLLHGEGDSCWPLVAQAAREGLPTRIGLEDTLAGPDGRPASGNAELVRCALEMLDATRR